MGGGSAGVVERGVLTASDDACSIAVRRAEVVGRLAREVRPGAEAVDSAASEVGLSRRQVYVLLRRYDGRATASFLLPRRSSGGRGRAGIRPPWWCWGHGRPTRDHTHTNRLITDLAHLQVIQMAAGAAFRDIDTADIADNPPTPINALARYQQARRVWVAVNRLDQPIAFVLIDIVDECAHIKQVSVHPDHSRQGIGRMLIDHVGAWAAGQGLRALTLTTFREAPWNAPYYQRLGFRELTEGPTTGLAAIMAAETASGLDPVTRVCMWRDIE